jgi:hypothetical protein
VQLRLMMCVILHSPVIIGSPHDLVKPPAQVDWLTLVLVVACCLEWEGGMWLFYTRTHHILYLALCRI